MTIVNKALTTDDTLLGAALSNKRNAGKLKAAGYETLGDLKVVTMSKLVELGIGEVTIEEIQNLVGEPAPEEAIEVKIEENDTDIHIRSPHGKFSLQILPGDIDRGPSGRGMRPVQPVYLVCVDGRGQMSRRMWLLHEFGRGDMRAVEEAEKKNVKWRVDAYKWLCTRKSYGRKFQIMSD